MKLVPIRQYDGYDKYSLIYINPHYIIEISMANGKEDETWIELQNEVTILVKSSIEEVVRNIEWSIRKCNI